MCLSTTQDCARDFLERAYTEILPRDASQRSCQQSSCRDLVHRSCHETSYGDLVQRPGDERIGLPRRSFLDTLNRDLLLRSLTKIFCGDLVWALCTDSPTQGSCIAASTQNLFYRDLHKGSLQNLTWYLFCFPLKVALVSADYRSFPPFPLDSYMRTVLFDASRMTLCWAVAAPPRLHA